MIRKIVGAFLGIASFFLFNFWFHPAISIRSAGLWGCIFAASLVFFAFEIISDFIIDEDFIGTGVSGGISAILLIILIIGGISGNKAFNAEKYKNFTKIEEGLFEEDIPKMTGNQNEVQVVDLEIAKKVGDRTIGGLKNATWYEVNDEYNLVEYKGGYYRISPLDYGSSIFKYNKSKAVGIPGYVIVNAMTQEAEYVEFDEPMYYSDSAYFSKKLSRHLRHQYSNLILGKSYFEIDDEGQPWWITSAKYPTIGMFKGKKVVNIILTNPTTGESELYEVKDIPSWVDHAFELDYLMEAAEWSFHYVNGWWNYQASKTNVWNIAYEYKDSEFAGYNSTLSKEGIAFFTGITPANGAEANVGFLFLNTRTGKINYYLCDGAEESSAMSSAQSTVQNYGYIASYPMVVNVDGIETYFMTLKDQAGLIQRYSLCNVENYTIVVEDSTITGVLEKYKEKMGLIEKEEKKSETISKIEGKVSDIKEAQIDGYSYYYIKLEGKDDIYMSSITLSNKQVYIKIGDNLKLEYTNSSEEGVFTVKKISF